MKKYGLQLRIPPQQKPQKQQQPSSAAAKRPPPSTAFGFGDDDDEDDVEKEIARQAARNRALKEVEEKHKKALEEDPSVFDYDGVYDEMKEKIAQPKMQDRTERKSKYIESLLHKAKERQMEHDVIYERKLLKERTKEDHLYEDKEKFVTSAYRKKLEEQNKWKEEERLRQLREEREDVTKGSVVDFYFNLDKNVAFGARSGHPEKPNKQESSTEKAESKPDRELSLERKSPRPLPSLRVDDEDEDGNTAAPARLLNNVESPTDAPGVASTSAPGERTKGEQEKPPAEQIEKSYKRSQDAVAAARERYLARKKAREQ